MSWSNPCISFPFIFKISHSSVLELCPLYVHTFPLSISDSFPLIPPGSSIFSHYLLFRLSFRSVAWIFSLIARNLEYFRNFTQFPCNYGISFKKNLYQLFRSLSRCVIFLKIIPICCWTIQLFFNEAVFQFQDSKVVKNITHCSWTLYCLSVAFFY